MKAVQPITIAEVPAAWVAIRREIIVREGRATRAGELNVDLSGAPYTIEVKSLTTNDWRPLTLPGDGIAFATAADRDAVLHQLQEGVGHA